MAREKDFNLDPVSKEPGAHLVGTGIGAALGGAAVGAAAGVLGGPLGAVAGGVIGAVAGGYGGKAGAEAVNPTAEEAYWRDNFNREPYYQAGRNYDDYAPAYRLGLYGYTEYSGIYDESESQLASQWDSRKENSSLSWDEASAASRAAWHRVDGRLTPANDATQSNEETVDMLNRLLEVSRDGEYGFRECAQHTEAQDIKTLLNRRADDCTSAATELELLIRQLGGKPDEGGTVGGALHRGWVSVRGTLSGYSDKAMLDECERGEDVAVAQYRKALKHDLPPATKMLVERQAQGVQRNHDHIKALRDALNAAA